MVLRLLSLLLATFAIAQSGVNTVVDETSLGGNLYLVNSTFQLAQDYVPPDLVRPNVRGGITMRQEAATALEAMFAAASEEDFEEGWHCVPRWFWHLCRWQKSCPHRP